MSDFVGFTDLFRVFRDEVLASNEKLSLDAVERDGADANVLGAACSAVGDEVIGQLAGVAAACWLDSAENQSLHRLVFDRYSLVCKQAAVALGSVEFSTIATTVAPFTVVAGTQLQTADGKKFLTISPVIFPAGSTGPVVARVRSSVAGKDQQVGVGMITSLTSQVSGAPADLTVTNSLATSGADDAESDDALRDRARQFWISARRGTGAAIEAATLAIPGVQKATAIEMLDVCGRPARFVQLIIADGYTDALVSQGVNPVTYQAQSQILAQVVYSGLSDVRAMGIHVEVLVAQVVLQPVRLRLRFQAGYDADAVADVARGTTIAFINSLRPGASLVISDLLIALGTVPGLVLGYGDEIESPAGDVLAQALQVLRTNLNLVTVASMQTDMPVAPTANPDYRYIRRTLGIQARLP